MTDSLAKLAEDTSRRGDQVRRNSGGVTLLLRRRAAGGQRLPTISGLEFLAPASVKMPQVQLTLHEVRERSDQPLSVQDPPLKGVKGILGPLHKSEQRSTCLPVPTVAQMPIGLMATAYRRKKLRGAPRRQCRKPGSDSQIGRGARGGGVEAKHSRAKKG